MRRTSGIIIQLARVGRLDNANVYFSLRLGGHNIGPRAAANNSRIHGDSTPEVGEARGSFDLPGKLDNRAGAG